MELLYKSIITTDGVLAAVNYGISAANGNAFNLVVGVVCTCGAIRVYELTDEGKNSFRKITNCAKNTANSIRNYLARKGLERIKTTNL